MDEIISSYPANEVKDLMFCTNVEIAYQKDMSESVIYDKDYFQKYINYEGTTLAKGLNLTRTSLVKKYCQDKDILDVGIGSGEFIKSSTNKVFGYDINQCGVNWLKQKGLFIDPFAELPDNIAGVTLWDALEHMKTPSTFLKLIKNKIVFVSMPMFDDIIRLKSSKHYKPNEHYYYFSPSGFTRFVNDVGFEVLEQNDGETKVGRESIFTFVLIKK